MCVIGAIESELVESRARGEQVAQQAAFGRVVRRVHVECAQQRRQLVLVDAHKPPRRYRRLHQDACAVWCALDMIVHKVGFEPP